MECIILSTEIKQKLFKSKCLQDQVYTSQGLHNTVGVCISEDE